jgi:hypothetical protein
MSAASTKQIAFISSLFTEAQQGFESNPEFAEALTPKIVAIQPTLVAVLGKGDVDKAEASTAISTLMEVTKILKTAEQAKIALPSDTEVAEWLLALGRKVEVSDLTAELSAFATRWALDYTGSFSFMCDMRDAAQSGPLSAGQAKGTLNCLRAEVARKGITGATTIDPEVGFYEVDGVVFKVIAAVNGSGNLYAKRLITGGFGEDASWVYDGRGSFALLTPETRLNAERAAALGSLYGCCCRCGKALTDEESIARGIGPVCATKGW